MPRSLLALIAAAVVSASASAQSIIYRSPPPAEFAVSPYSPAQPLVYTSGASYFVNPIWYPNYTNGAGGPGYQYRGTPHTGANGGLGVGVGYGSFGGGYGYGGGGLFLGGGYVGGGRRR